jgi:Ser/Thr protein kinase RdoA (MazF antagonist)
MAEEYTPAVVAELTARVADNVARWRLSPAASVALLSVSENATFLLRDPDRRELVLRVHRVGYSSAEEICSELAWMGALRRDGVVEAAPAIPGADGQYVQLLASRTGGPERFAVAFERLPGTEPESRDAALWFERLGELTARMHRHARSWPLPQGFRRKRWDFDAMVGPQAFWGSWRSGIGLDKAGVLALEKALDVIRLRLERLGRGAEVFGLVHADLRLANLLVDGEHLRVIDFDDCGFSWYLYDFATSVSFIEHEPTVPDLLRAWIRGYCRQLPLRAEVRAEIPTFVVLRRILLTAWLASHSEVPFAREVGNKYTAGTVQLAQELLRGEYLAAAVI